MGSVDGRAARWDVPAYQVVATIGALALLAMSWLVGGEHPRWENLVLAGIAGGYAISLGFSEWARRHRQAGIELTESCAMLPAASVSGWYFWRPEARYFGVGKLGRDQVADYARRKGMPLPEMERWLAANLSYER